MKTNHLSEEVISMPPLSMATIEAMGEMVVEEFVPHALTHPTELDFIELHEKILPERGIHVVPASDDELVDCHGATPPDGDGEINILIREDHWTNLHRGGRRAHFARSTLAHELAHAILHVPVVRRRRSLKSADVLLRRVSRASIPAFRDPEWQAWALAGCIVAPPKTIAMLPAKLSTAAIADFYGVSEPFMANHLRRIRKGAS